MMGHPFDSAAEAYDLTFTHTTVGRAQRHMVRKHLAKHLSGEPLRILELNCGTGEDAIWLTGQGHQVTATDVSEKMLAITQKKSQDTHVALDVRSWDMRQPWPYSSASFDLIFSNFGGINCLSPAEITRLGHQLHQLLRPGGKCILVVMNNNCLWENIYRIFKGNWRPVNRRKNKQAISVAVSPGESILTYYYHPEQLQQSLGSQFQRQRQRPVGLFIPPSYLENLIIRYPGIIRPLIYLEARLGNNGLTASLGDHFLLELSAVDPSPTDAYRQKG